MLLCFYSSLRAFASQMRGNLFVRAISLFVQCRSCNVVNDKRLPRKHKCLLAMTGKNIKVSSTPRNGGRQSNVKLYIITLIYNYFLINYFPINYFPIQNFEKILLSTSSLQVSPVNSPSKRPALRISIAIISPLVF